MSVLSQDSQRRLGALLQQPLPEWQMLAAQYAADKSLEVEFRYKQIPGLDDKDNPWRLLKRHGHDFHLGGTYECIPNWQCEYHDYRVAEKKQ